MQFYIRLIPTSGWPELRIQWFEAFTGSFLKIEIFFSLSYHIFIIKKLRFIFWNEAFIQSDKTCNSKQYHTLQTNFSSLHRLCRNLTKSVELISSVTISSDETAAGIQDDCGCRCIREIPPVTVSDLYFRLLNSCGLKQAFRPVSSFRKLPVLPYS